MLRNIILILSLMLPSSVLSQQTHVVNSDRGGLISSRTAQVDRFIRNNTRVRIEGDCFSSCTMLLGVPNVCVSSSARLGFHGPSSYGRSLGQRKFNEYSRLISSYYSPSLRSAYMNRYRHSQSLTILSGSQINSMGYRRCR